MEAKGMGQNTIKLTKTIQVNKNTNNTTERTKQQQQQNSR